MCESDEACDTTAPIWRDLSQAENQISEGDTMVKQKHWYMPFEIKDWLSDISLSSVSAAARGVWIDILCLMYLSDDRGRLGSNSKPWSIKKIAQVLRGEAKNNQELIEELIGAGVADWNASENVLTCRRMVREAELSQVKSEAGRLGGKAKAARIKGTNQGACSSKKASKSLANSDYDYDYDSNSKSDSQKNEARKTKHSTDAEVEEIYKAYPRKVGKRAAIKAIKAALSRIDEERPAEWLKSRVAAFAKSPAGSAGKFTPYPATWFNGERFNDDETEWKRNGSDTQSRTSRVSAPHGKYDGK